MKRIKIGSGYQDEAGNTRQVYLDVPEPSDYLNKGVDINRLKHQSPEVFRLEMSYEPIELLGYRLVEEARTADGTIHESQSFEIAPDDIFALYAYLRKTDVRSFPETGSGSDKWILEDQE